MDSIIETIVGNSDGVRAYGDVASTLLNNGMDPCAMRPWIGSDGRPYVSKVVNGKAKAMPLIGNSTATLRKDEWIQIDATVLKIARERLRAVADLRASGLVYTIPNGMATSILQHETQSDINDARITMDPVAQGDNDRPVYELTSLPLPVIYKDFNFTARQIATSRNGNTPLDMTMVEQATRKVAEAAEKLLLGTWGSYAFGGGTIYGYTNYPNRITRTLTAPTDSAWTGSTLVGQVLAMRQDSVDAKYYGPWRLYLSTGWLKYIDDDYSSSKGDNTVRQRIQAIEGIQSVDTLDYLTGYQALLVQQSSDVVREVIGMDMTTVQWETHGGMLKHFKVMAIMVPQLRCDQNSNTGIVHGSSSEADLD